MAHILSCSEGPCSSVVRSVDIGGIHKRCDVIHLLSAGGVALAVGNRAREVQARLHFLIISTTLMGEQNNFKHLIYVHSSIEVVRIFEHYWKAILHLIVFTAVFNL